VEPPPPPPTQAQAQAQAQAQTQAQAQAQAQTQTPSLLPALAGGPATGPARRREQRVWVRRAPWS